MDVRFGKIKATSETYANPQKQDFEAAEENFFNTFQHRRQEQSPEHNNEKKVTIPLRLNDIDSNILEDKAYNNLEDTALKLEHKITALENSIKKITKEITTIEGLGYDIQLFDLKRKKIALESELNKLKQDYANQDISTKLSNSLTSALGIASKNKTLLNSIKVFCKKQIFARLSKNFSYAVAMKEALDNLNNINDTIDELIKMQAPYGENIDRYQKLTAYLNKANIIHAQINSKFKAK